MADSRSMKNGWKQVKFGDVVALNKERISDPASEGIERYVGIEHIKPEDLRIRSWGLVAEGTTFTKYFRPGQVLFVKRRAYQRKVGLADFSGVCSGDIYVLEPKDSQVLLPELLPFICQTDGFFNHAVGTSAGSLSPRTNWKQLANYEFALPPLEEQHRFVELFSAADSCVNQYVDGVNAAYKLRDSIRKNEFDPVYHEVHTLAELCGNSSGIKIGPFGAQLHQSDYVTYGVPVVMPANMVDEKIETSEIARIPEEKAQALSVHRVKPGDILLPRRGDLDRRVYVEDNNEGWLCGTGSIRIRVEDSVSSKAVFHALASAHAVRWIIGNAVGTTMLNLNSKIVGRIPVALPAKYRQTIVVDTLDRLQEQIGNLEKRLEHARRMKIGLLNRSYGGEHVTL